MLWLVLALSATCGVGELPEECAPATATSASSPEPEDDHLTMFQSGVRRKQHHSAHRAVPACEQKIPSHVLNLDRRPDRLTCPGIE
ncbi:unnamed protein product [Effrenium voratum]|uniref:Secreted protein n=1 Tax=Effrenium voratum TaxID=2562239 RepID=A0AA36HLN0_9DINO|nr:unnamed protein product [Effrenium voratum]